MAHRRKMYPTMLLVIGVFHAGCNQTEMSPDFARTVAAERRQRAEEHGHDHDDHAHPHAHDHDHPHLESKQGGQMVAIGHTHQNKGATHYHAEIMPLLGKAISFRILSADASGASNPVSVAADKIMAYAAALSQKAGLATELIFLPAESSDRSMWSATIPESLRDGRRLSVVVPKIVLEGERFNFSFRTGIARKSQSEKTTVEVPQ